MVDQKLKRIAEVLTNTFTIGEWKQPLVMRRYEKKNRYGKSQDQKV